MFHFRRVDRPHADWQHLSELDRLRLQFLSYTAIDGGVLGCWIWQNSGRFNVQGLFPGRIWKASRASYRLFVGDPTGRDVLHICDVQRCVSPLHLYLGGDLENVNDRQVRKRSRGRHSKMPTDQKAWTDQDFLEKQFGLEPARLVDLVVAIRAIAK